MFELTDNFNLHNTDLIPHTLVPEIHSAVQNLHASVDERGFVLKSIGNRWIFKTPILKAFDLSLTFSYNYLTQFSPCTYVLFGYNVRKRQGNAICLKYDLNGVMEVSLVKVNLMQITQIGESVKFDDFNIKDNETVSLSINVSADSLKGRLANRDFSFEVEATCGNIALERKNFVGEWIIKHFSISTEDNLPQETLLAEKNVKIPLRDGGDIPYEFTYKAEKIGSQCYFFVNLDGGTATRAENKKDRPYQYIAEQDSITSPFVIIRNGERKKEFNLYNGTKIICDPNICWDCLKEYFNHPNMPICTAFPIDEKDITESTSISFGYENMSCIGYLAQAGGPSEFIFDVDGSLIYDGDKLEESIFELHSPADKYATKLIPENTYRRAAVIHHLSVNHYFHTDESITLTMSLKSKLPLEHFYVEAEIRDVYDSICLAKPIPEITKHDWMFGYREICAKIQCSPLPLGVYRIVFNVHYGDSIYKSYNKVFEVFNKDANVSPAQASGLPFTFSMPNEQKWLMSNTFDLWNPKPSCDEIHFISCVTNTPIEAKEQKIWELIHIFGRQWYAWLTNRACSDWSHDANTETVKYSDYLNTYLPDAFYPRVTTYLLTPYQNPKYRKLLHEFLEENPAIAEKIIYKVSENTPELQAFTYEQLGNLLETCHTEWFAFFNGKLLEKIRAQNKELKRINPNFKRSFYGPFFQYVTSTVSYHTAKAFGYNPDSSLSDDIFTGFAVFEDYPSPCAYPTYRGAFATMTLLLHCPNLVIYPEQYSGSDGGCIDGAVKFAHAPMGKYDTPLYFNSTHAFEYVFNTPHRRKEGYSYWTAYGFHRRDHAPEMADKLTRDWKTVIDNKPSKPLRTMAMITEYFDEEDYFSDKNLTLHGFTIFSNISEEGHGYIYDCARECGLNAPFALKFETLPEISNQECDVLVLPTLKYASKKTIEKIRDLYKNGVSLIAVSDICGLEDIFGVKESIRSSCISELCTDDDSELIYPNEAQFKYESNGAQTLMSSENGIPILLKNNRTLLINVPISKLGFECFEGREGNSKNNVSELLRRTLKSELIKLSSPLALGENVGITLFESKNRNKQLLAIDYSPYDNRNIPEHSATVKINFPVKKISSERDFVSVLDNNGYIKEIRFKILRHESVMFRLI